MLIQRLIRVFNSCTYSNKEILVYIKLHEILAGRLWKFTFAGTFAAHGRVFMGTLARNRELINFIKSSYASLVSIPATVLFEVL